MQEGVEGLLRDKTRPSRLGPYVKEQVVALTLKTSLAKPRTGPPR